MAKAHSYWLLKTEPSTYSFDALIKEKSTKWNGVRNYQARNNLQKMASGDIALIYHSGDDKAVVGIAEICKGPYPEVTEKPSDSWVQVDIKAVKKLQRAIELSEIKKTALLKDLPLIKQSRLSVMPITPDHFKTILELADRK